VFTATVFFGAEKVGHILIKSPLQPTNQPQNRRLEAPRGQNMVRSRRQHAPGSSTTSWGPDGGRCLRLMSLFAPCPNKIPPSAHKPASKSTARAPAWPVYGSEVVDSMLRALQLHHGDLTQVFFALGFRSPIAHRQERAPLGRGCEVSQKTLAYAAFHGGDEYFIDALPLRKTWSTPGNFVCRVIG